MRDMLQESLVDSNWAEIADHIETIEELYEVCNITTYPFLINYYSLRSCLLVRMLYCKTASVRIQKSNFIFLSYIYVLVQDDKFDNRELAALIASKVHYHLEQFDESLSYALGAGSLFTDQITSGKPSQYVHTILSKVIFLDRFFSGYKIVRKYKREYAFL